ncbi:restriction endonuclease subunit S [Streptococcus salivarius]|jgi:hsdS specificity protein of type I restriction-modification system|uniref:restriction endonuclease subunit S n=1 Tax=Streptococcus TaxID=1301 RepID=UPI000CE19997|nr:MULTISPECIES: restriction endonuclease subunit S [Streptococcus]MBK5070567.1 restriction endonuclease subunit S [Streptococcus sp. 21.1]PPA33502.1 restriction endonuclease subunit S [Streptococcus salivarius]RGR62382.1 restriction endonuclease subunit S [Streptococcus salivarius]
MNKPKIRFNEFENIWTKSKLGELYEVYSGNTPSRSDNRNYQNGEIPWIKTTDLNNSIICSNEEKISVYGATKLKVLPEKSVLIAMYGGFNQIGRTGLLAYPATINQALVALMPVNEINPNFLLNFLNFKKESWRNVAASSRKDPNITKNDVEKFKISFPSIDEQSAIGFLFRTLDDLLASYKDNLANYQSLKAAMLSKMFPKAGKAVPEIRLDGFEGEWRIIKLGDVLSELKSGLSRELSNDDIGLPVIRANNISDGILNLDRDIKYWFKEDPKGANTANYFVKENDILVNFINSEAKMGTAAIVLREPDRETIYTTNILKLTVKEDYYPYFIYLMTFVQSYQNYIKSITKPAVNQASFTTVDFKKYDFLCPAFREQQAIGSYFSNLDQLITSYQEKITQLETLKKKLLQDMFI